MSASTGQQPALTLRELLERYTRPAAPELVRTEDGAIRCLACGHRCLVRPGRSGICRVRFNRDGTLLVPWGYVASVQCDPIEKKPFFHVLPGRDAFTFGMLGCDYHCPYCQNWVTSQALRDPRAIAPPRFCSAEELADLAVQYGAGAVVSSYNEPLITSEWAVAVFQEARKRRRFVCGYVSNGNATREVLEYIRPHAEIYKIDLKGFDDKKYRQLGGVLKNVLRTIEMVKEMGFWTEIVTLVVPGFNDSEQELRSIARFIAGVSREIPWHVTAFHPDYKMNEENGYTMRTPAETLLRACEIGKEEGLWFVYAGNLPGQVGDWEHTFCPFCGVVLIKRYGFYVLLNAMEGNRCYNCQKEIPGVWEADPPRQSTGHGFPRPVRLPGDGR